MYWKPVIVGLGGLAGVHAVEERAIGDVLAGAPISNISVSASNLAQCGEATVSWTGTVPPVSLMVGTGGYYANLQQVQTIDNLDGSSTQVQIDQKEGTTMIFQVTDGSGQVGYVQNLKVGGGDSSCLNEGGGASSSGSGESSSAASSSGGGAAAPSVVQPSSSTWSESEASSSEAAAPASESSAAPAPSSSSSVAPTQSPSASASAASASNSTSTSASASASVSSVSAAGASSSNGGTVDASAANASSGNGASGLVVPGLTAAVGLVGAAAAVIL